MKAAAKLDNELTVADSRVNPIDRDQPSPVPTRTATTRTRDELEPQQLTFLQFCEHAHIVPLKNHGRAAEVFFLGVSLRFVDETGIAGLMQAHRSEVNNALYAHSGDAPDFLTDRALPSAAALAEYPAMRGKFPQACRLVDEVMGAPVSPQPTQLRAVDTPTLLAELRARGTLMPLHHAVGALHDHLECTGHLNADSPMLAFRTFRLRRFDAAISGTQNAAAIAEHWEKRVDALDVGRR
ncbi:hypothetical protein [Burkholderia sp. BE17]|uniref:hypothetical protein n=1 Tax=Burkholderia sp. BE17 TaxID=2656644 RepID=UPI00128B3A7F|nr:hypothetical protein [Burkholderia sp. BE17]MPV65680.1 hypothetical protein [Burkholderia sp. BE17]